VVTEQINSISKLTGGSQWRSHSIGQLGLIQSKSYAALAALRELVKGSLNAFPATQENNGMLNKDLVEALVKYQRRQERKEASTQGRQASI